MPFRNENYTNPLTGDVNAAGLDVGLNHSLQFDDSSLVNRLTRVPACNEVANYRVTHESVYERPHANPAGKLRVGDKKDYNSKPGKGGEKRETGYEKRSERERKEAAKRRGGK